MLGIPNGSRLDNALKVNRGTLTGAREQQLRKAQTKTTVRGDAFAKKPAAVTGIDYKTGKKRVIRVKVSNQMTQRLLGIDPNGVKPLEKNEDAKAPETEKEAKKAEAKKAEAKKETKKETKATKAAEMPKSK